MNDEISIASNDGDENVRKRNIQGLLGLLKMKNEYGYNESKTYRVQKNEFQRKILKDVYKITKFPSKQTRDDLALLLNHTNRGIQIWFQNQRNSKDDKSKRQNDSHDTSESEEKPKKTTIDMSILIDIIERNIPKNKKNFWENFINHRSKFY